MTGTYYYVSSNKGENKIKIKIKIKIKMTTFDFLVVGEPTYTTLARLAISLRRVD